MIMMPRSRLTRRRFESEQLSASYLAMKYASLAVAAVDEGDLSLYDEIIVFLHRQSTLERGAALLRQEGLLLSCARSLAQKGAARSKVLADLKLLECLIHSSAGAREFVAYGGHGTLMQLLSSVDEEVPCAVDDLLLSVGETCSEIGHPFPSLGHRQILDQGEIAGRPVHIYNFAVEGGAAAGPCTDDDSRWTVLVQSVPLAQECQFTVGYIMWPAAIILGTR